MPSNVHRFTHGQEEYAMRTHAATDRPPRPKQRPRWQNPYSDCPVGACSAVRYLRSNCTAAVPVKRRQRGKVCPWLPREGLPAPCGLTWAISWRKFRPRKIRFAMSGATSTLPIQALLPGCLSCGRKCSRPNAVRGVGFCAFEGVPKIV